MHANEPNKCTLQVIIITGRVQMSRKSMGVSWGSRNLVQERALYFRREDSTRRGSSLEKTNPIPGTDFSISPSGLSYEIQSSVLIGWYWFAFLVRFCGFVWASCAWAQPQLCGQAFRRVFYVPSMFSSEHVKSLAPRLLVS